MIGLLRILSSQKTILLVLLKAVSAHAITNASGKGIESSGVPFILKITGIYSFIHTLL